MALSQNDPIEFKKMLASGAAKIARFKGEIASIKVYNDGEAALYFINKSATSPNALVSSL
jgi:hypothetical protein